MKPAAPGAEGGFTLIELVVLVALLAIVAGFAGAALAQRPAQAHNTATAFAGLVAEARALAAITGDGTITDATGSTIGVVRDGDDYVATLYAFRPILGASRSPVAAPNTPPLRTLTELGLVLAHRTIQPPFALFFSASGHASAQASFSVGVDPPLAAEPACPLETGIVIAFIDRVHDQAHAVSCEMAQLELDTSTTVESR